MADSAIIASAAEIAPAKRPMMSAFDSSAPSTGRNTIAVTSATVRTMMTMIGR